MEMTSKTNMWIMKPLHKGIINKKYDKYDIDYKYFPNGRGYASTQHKTGIYDYYLLIYDEEEGSLYNESSEWIAKLVPVKSTGNFIIIHCVWNDEKDKEEILPITISVREMRELFKNDD